VYGTAFILYLIKMWNLLIHSFNNINLKSNVNKYTRDKEGKEHAQMLKRGVCHRKSENGLECIMF
jgi:hypothetical protein